MALNQGPPPIDPNELKRMQQGNANNDNTFRPPTFGGPAIHPPNPAGSPPNPAGLNNSPTRGPGPRPMAPPTPSPQSREPRMSLAQQQYAGGNAGGFRDVALQRAEALRNRLTGGPQPVGGGGVQYPAPISSPRPSVGMGPAPVSGGREIRSSTTPPQLAPHPMPLLNPNYPGGQAPGYGDRIMPWDPTRMIQHDMGPNHIGSVDPGFAGPMFSRNGGLSAPPQVMPYPGAQEMPQPGQAPPQQEESGGQQGGQDQMPAWMRARLRRNPGGGGERGNPLNGSMYAGEGLQGIPQQQLDMWNQVAQQYQNQTGGGIQWDPSQLSGILQGNVGMGPRYPLQ